MKKIMVIISIFFISGMMILNGENLIKRKIVIIPFFNQNDNKEYNYLTDTIRDALRAKLLGTELFVLANFSDIDKQVANSSKEDLSKNESKAIDMAIKLKSDVVITGKFIVIQDKVMITASAFDVLQEQSVISSTVNGDTGVNIFTLVEKISLEMTTKISKAFPKVDKTLLEELMAKQEKKYSADQSKDKGNATKNQLSPDEEKFDNMLKASKGFRTGGVVCVAVGTGVAVILGVPFTALGYYMSTTYTTSYSSVYNVQDAKNVMYAGIALIAIGGTLDIISIPLFIVAGVLYYKYNNHIAFNVRPFFNSDFKEMKFGIAMKL